MKGLAKVCEFSLELSQTLNMHGRAVGRYKGSFQWMEVLGLGEIPLATLTVFAESAQPLSYGDVTGLIS